MKAEANIYEINEEKYKKIITMSLAGLLIGSLLFIFGLSVKETHFPLLVNYSIAMVLYISSFLAVFNNYKIYPAKVFKYIMLISVFFIVLITYAFVIEIL